MPPKKGTYYVVYGQSASKHIQAYRDAPFPLCSIGTKNDARAVCEGVEDKVDAMPICPHCLREAGRISLAMGVPA